MQRFCEHCGKPFEAKPAHVKAGQARYCSMKCRRGLNPIVIDSDTAFVHLTDRHDNVKAVAKIDAADVPKLEAFGKRWAASWWERAGQYRAVARVQLEPEKKLGRKAKTKTVSMHRWLMDAPDGVEVDHENHDTLDNRRGNLRFTTRSQNMQNREGPRRDNRSGVRNVTLLKNGGYHVRLKVNGKVHFLGNFDSLVKAEAAATDARRRYMTHSSD